MNERHSDLLDRARGLATARALIEHAIELLVVEAVEREDDCVSAVARHLQLHRSTIYRMAANALQEHECHSVRSLTRVVGPSEDCLHGRSGAERDSKNDINCVAGPELLDRKEAAQDE